MDEKSEHSWEDPGLRWRTYVSIAGGLGWLAFVALWWLFMGDDYDNYQNVAVTLVSLMVVAGILGGAWLTWARRHDVEFRTQVAVPGFWPRVAASVAIFAGLTVAALYWLWYMAGEYNLCQNLGLFLLLFVILAATMTPLWMRWGMRYGARAGREAGEEVAVAVTAAVGEAIDEARRAVDEARAEAVDAPEENRVGTEEADEETK
jgi:hypothetical protein